ncbi:helix-turn-helix domain-containing protein [Actinokineospora sp. G85]|uniref:helix-turn-helix domain-containing protein n=1 Tax=Pseudonocardiaceae TaxID=2070 RepID=UPI00058D6687
MTAERPARPVFGEVIRGARRKRGWSQEELGRAAGLSRPTIARVESDSDVSTATIGKIAQALGLRLELTDRS